MPRMVSLKRPKQDAPKPSDGPIPYPGDDGVSVHLEHHHLTKLGVGGNLKSGHKVSFSGEGTVERSETTSGQDGERHSATIRLHKGSLDHDGDEEENHGALRSELMRQHEKQESAAHEKAERKAAKAGKITD